jgi:hypothetical protein
MGKCSPQGKGWWSRPGAPPQQWKAERRRQLQTELTSKQMPPRVFEITKGDKFQAILCRRTLTLTLRVVPVGPKPPVGLLRVVVSRS